MTTLMVGNQALSPGLDLTPIGMTDCVLHVSPFVILPMDTMTSTVSSLDVSIPNMTGILGETFVLQFAVPNAGTNPFGVKLSNALALRIGSATP